MAGNPLAALLLADGRLPIGGHTQSAGLEAAFLAGMPVAQVPGYLTTRLRTATLVDAAVATVARHYLRAGRDLQPVEDAWSARVPSQGVRAASIEVGRGMTRLLRSLGGDLPMQRPPRPIALAALGIHLRLDQDELVRAVCHDDIQAVCAATLKLAPGDPAETVRWALACGPQVEAVVAACADLQDCDDLPAAAAPAAELWQHDHAYAPRRLFRA